jgi:hypothetical protein
MLGSKPQAVKISIILNPIELLSPAFGQRHPQGCEPSILTVRIPAKERRLASGRSQAAHALARDGTWEKRTELGALIAMSRPPFACGCLRAHDSPAPQVPV